MRKQVAALTCLALLILAAGGCSGYSGPREQTKSLLGRTFPPVEIEPEERADRVMKLAAARRAYELDPGSEEKIIWLGRRTAYLGHYHQAIDIYTEGLRRHPESYRLLRHRGHRKISIRRFRDAIADLERAADLARGVPDEMEPDGLPNRLNQPTSTTHTNIYYHLGLARYLVGDFEAALDAYRKCLDFSTNDDMTCATTYWLYLTLRRLGRSGEADSALDPISSDMDVIENVAYHRLLLLYKGELTPAAVLAGDDPAFDAPEPESIDDATLGYGVGAWFLVNGELAQAETFFARVVRGNAWPAFGFIAAEVELADWSRRSLARAAPAALTTGRSARGSSPARTTPG